MKKNSRVFVAVAVFAVLFLYNAVPSAHAALCNVLGPTVAIPTGYGASYNPLTTAKEYLVSGDCGTTNATVSVGNGNSLTYVYNKGYYYTGTAWQQYTLSCRNLISNAWCVGKGTVSVPIPQNPTNVIGYACQWNGTEWKCGCRDGTCTSRYWQLQQLMKPTTGGTCVPSLTNPAPRPETPRDRVRIVNNSVLTDTGMLLRGAHLNANSSYDLAWFRTMRDKYGLNTMRLDVRITTRPTNASYPDSTAYLKPDLEQVWRSVDKVVDLAQQAGMYLIITNFTSCCGEYHEDLNKIFWGAAAPRYKDRKHVLYEVQNEPTAWTPEKYDATAIAFEEEMYRYIRERAPLTHIIMWTPAHGTRLALLGKVRQGTDINYSNASVGIHAYGFTTEDPNFTNTINLKKEYPVFMTEYSMEPGNQTDTERAAKLWQYLETNKISWTFMDLSETTSGGFGNFGTGVSLPCQWNFLWPAPAQ